MKNYEVKYRPKLLVQEVTQEEAEQAMTGYGAKMISKKHRT
jgi:hypothetical protein